ncbi:hypothetical protein [Bdellovibrio sp.]|uniref:hypothetical protein n=1 Tax=Bdellovibrio sp. TaxID=28201 RepID=UPI0039E69E80
MKSKIILFLCFLFSTNIYALNNRHNFIYQGRIVKPDGQALSDASVIFNIKIKSPDGSCLVYEEAHTTAVGDGFFSLNIGEGTRLDGGSASFSQAFMSGINFPSCGYTTGASDDRLLSVSFTVAGETVDLGSQKVKSVPYSLESYNSQFAGAAAKIGNTVSTDVLTVDGATAANVSTSRNLSISSFQKLVDFLNGTSVSQNPIGLGAYTTAQEGSATFQAGQIWYNSSTNEVKYYTGTEVRSINFSGPSGGSGSYITTLTGDITSSGFSSGSVTTTIADGAVSALSKVVATPGSAGTNRMLATDSVTGTTIKDFYCSTVGHVLKWTGANGFGCAAVTSAEISDATSSNTASTVVKRDVSGNFSAGTITADVVGNVSNSGALTISAGGANTNVTLVPQGTGVVSVSSKRIANVATPTASSDAATKAYVDAASSGGITFMGFTSSAYNGNLIGAAGVATGGHALCNAAYSGSHWASWEEIQQIGAAYPATYTVWVRDAIASTFVSGGVTYVGKDGSEHNNGGSWSGSSCYSWTNTASTNRGTIYSTSGQIGMGTCNDPYRLACVK